MECVTQNHLFHFLANLDCPKAFLVLFQFNPSQKDSELVGKGHNERANLGLIQVFEKVKST